MKLHCATNENEIRTKLETEEKKEKKESIELANICSPVSIVNMILNQLYYETWSMCALWQHSQSNSISCPPVIGICCSVFMCINLHTRRKTLRFFSAVTFLFMFWGDAFQSLSLRLVHLKFKNNTTVSISSEYERLKKYSSYVKKKKIFSPLSN